MSGNPFLRRQKSKKEKEYNSKAQRALQTKHASKEGAKCRNSGMDLGKGETQPGKGRLQCGEEFSKPTISTPQ